MVLIDTDMGIFKRDPGGWKFRDVWHPTLGCKNGLGQLHLITHQYLVIPKRRCLAQLRIAVNRQRFLLDAFHILYIFGAP
jgi:hypothetical protein